MFGSYGGVFSSGITVGMTTLVKALLNADHACSIGLKANRPAG